MEKIDSSDFKIIHAVMLSKTSESGHAHIHVQLYIVHGSQFLLVCQCHCIFLRIFCARFQGRKCTIGSDQKEQIIGRNMTNHLESLI